MIRHCNIPETLILEEAKRLQKAHPQMHMFQALIEARKKLEREKKQNG